MCFDKLNLTAKLVDNKFIFSGYKIFRERDATLFNYNGGLVRYERNIWHKAELEGNDNVGRRSTWSSDYLHGFHFFATKDDAETFSDRFISKGIVLECKFQELLSCGIQCGVPVYCANQMYIDRPQFCSELKEGDRFYIDDENMVHVKVKLHSMLRLKDSSLKNIYVNENTNILHGCSSELKVTKV